MPNPMQAGGQRNLNNAMPYRDPFQAGHSFDRPPPLPSRPLRPQAQSHPHPMLTRQEAGHVRAAPTGARAQGTGGGAGTGPEGIASAWFDNASAERVNVDIQIYRALKYANPDVEVLDTTPYNANIIAYVSVTGDGSIESLGSGVKVSALLDGSFKIEGDIAETLETSKGRDSGAIDSLSWIQYLPPARRLDGGSGYLAKTPLFERFLVKWKEHEFEVYMVDHRDGADGYPQSRQFILTTEPGPALELLKAAGVWMNNLQEEIWVFDQGWWQKDANLYRTIQKSHWKDIILQEELKEDLLKTILRFFDSRETYDRLHVPWKRGLIFYGPPGNGKTVSIKATMKTLLDRKNSIPTLYVKSLKSFFGPEASISDIFSLARQQAPCYLVFEDLDSLVTDDVRSFFLNAVDGLSENEGILMVGSTNHLERLDPGIAKRPSRFDRKYLFPDPALEERKRYCNYWQTKLKDNDEVKFPDKLVGPIAALLDGFSFAYMQEAFVSTLLKIANDEQGKDREEDAWDIVDGLEQLEIVGEDKGGNEDELDKYVLWREIKVQIANLRKELK